MKLLFICNQGKHRSKTAECLFKKEFQTDSAGLYSEKLVTQDQLEWADIIFVMEDFQRKELIKRFPETCLHKRLLTMNISDEFQFNQPELVVLLQKRLSALLQPFQQTL
ncbi:phosphotyrosine protein phosphatase [Candidatus Woesearchaeota archaeon CG10_big_fil_rev_8_21_14_0_10_37_12]|nr:MAG: phosphotyrosine protein phosphatase [Candidatus Woesearchaeota archaeon CG10_big_fil_rev_8_21_14_0_10_37_12]